MHALVTAGEGLNLGQTSFNTSAVLTVIGIVTGTILVMRGWSALRAERMPYSEMGMMIAQNVLGITLICLGLGIYTVLAAMNGLFSFFFNSAG